MGSHRGPFVGKDRIDRRITQCAVGHPHVRPQHPVQFGPQPFNRAAALVVDEMGTEFYRDTVQNLESVGQ